MGLSAKAELLRIALATSGWLQMTARVKPMLKDISFWALQACARDAKRLCARPHMTVRFPKMGTPLGPGIVGFRFREPPQAGPPGESHENKTPAMAIRKIEKQSIHVLQNASDGDIVAAWLLMATGRASNHQAPDSA